ncbi:DUF4235 domain-containing protein [Cellulomonas carbonis]|uniref:DUF4235 domain-containing protein n=1 Tax=Cellulomonas carbonis TaxID=1386092 RepID=UPI000AB550F3|nr:DUF4235 domain-containing protein [Cellulomonas carbonis]GGC00428.1 hypothetical protein GCM10010972_11480 [Cellulomonas carbonis]
MGEQKQDMVAKALGLAVALGAAWVAQQLINQVWTRTFGHKPPKPEDEGDSRFGEVAAAATVTGAVVALARVLATRGAARFIK